MHFDRRGFLQLCAGALAGLRTRPARAEAETAAYRVHRQTRNTLTGALGRVLSGGGTRPALEKRYAGIPRLELAQRHGAPEVTLDEVVGRFAPAAALGPAPVSLGLLARLLHLTNGVTRPGSYPLRAAPSAGALYAGEVYVIARDVVDLAPGVYSYHVRSHSLVPLGSREGLAACLERPDAVRAAPVAIALSNVFLRYTHRYANRGYRYALIDSGHIGENLRLAAAAAGLAVHSPLRFHDDRLNALLGIDGRREAVCALHVLGQATEDSGATTEPLAEAHEAGDFAPDPKQSEPERYHAATKLVTGPAAPRAPAAAAPATDASSPVALPARVPAAATLAWTIEERRSADRFDVAPMRLADLAYLLKLAQGNAAAAQAPWIELRVVAHAVSGLEPGVYRYDRAAHVLDPIRKESLRGALERACGGQEKAGQAAVGFVMVGALEAAFRGGDRAYRDLLIEAGAVGQRLYLGAEAIGLTARNLAAFFDDRLNDLLEVDGRSQAVVHLTMAGPGR